jgi:hypothetical protein
MVRRQKNDLCDAQTQVQPRAAGVSPPWLSEPNVVRPESRNVRRLANTESRAAGVSPPWCFGNAIATAADFFGLNTFLHRTFGEYTYHERRRYAPAPGCTVFRASCGEPIFPTAHLHKSGGREPAVGVREMNVVRNVLEAHLQAP